MQNEEQGGHAFLTALGVCLFLIGASFFLLKTFPVPLDRYDEAFMIAVFFVIALISVITYQSGNITKTAESLAHVMTEDILTYSHELFSELYRSSPVPYMVIDMSGKIQSANTATARFFDLGINDLVGRDVLSYIDESSHKVAVVPTHFTQGNSIHNLEVLVHLPNGADAWAMLSLFPFKGKKNIKQGLLTLIDITKLKQIDIAKTEFVSLASHQLRTPISGMKWNIELLLTTGKDAMNEKHRVYVEKVARSLEQMNSLVDDFLSASKFELGTLKPVPETFMSTAFFTKIVDEYEDLSKRREVTVALTVPPFQIVSDSHLLHMAVSNLVGNAIKYTDKGGTVTCTVTENGSTMTVVVVDTGIGIPIQDQSTIFSKMFRATNARNHSSGGTGLGLYIAKQSAEVLGGTVSFESIEGKGTTFTVVLPVTLGV